MINKLLTKDFIRCNIDAKNKEDLVHEGLRPLLEKGYVLESYEKAILENFEKHGNYMAIAPGFLLSHARPEDGVKELGMSLINLKEGVNIGSENDPIKLVITLAAKDSESHIGALQELMGILMDEEDFETLKTTKNEEEVLEIINKER